MVHSRLFCEDVKYREMIFTTCEQDRPLVVQFNANNPDLLVQVHNSSFDLKPFNLNPNPNSNSNPNPNPSRPNDTNTFNNSQAASMVVDKCDAIDINFGCPQDIAKKGRYGAYLLEEPDVCRSLVEAMSKHLSHKVPVCCKIRLLPIDDREERITKTIEFAKMLVKAGCQLLTVHGRTRLNRGQHVGACDWDAIRRIKEALDIPVFANGSIETLGDVKKCQEATGCDGIMSAEALLGNPGLFAEDSTTVPDPVQLAWEYIELAEQYPVHYRMVRAHLFKILYDCLASLPELRAEVGTIGDAASARLLMEKVEAQVSPETRRKPSDWILRHRPDRREPTPKELERDKQAMEAAVEQEEQPQTSLFADAGDDY